MFDDAGRERWSWAKELCAGLVNAFPDFSDDIDGLQQLGKRVLNNPDGGYLRIDESPSTFVWGNIRYLSDNFKLLTEKSECQGVWQDTINRNLIGIDYMAVPRLSVHHDSAPQIPSTILANFGRTNVTQALQAFSKADIILASQNTSKVVGLSVKSGTGESEVKLSQQSTSVTYPFNPNPYILQGGLGIDSVQKLKPLLENITNDDLVVSKTALRPDQFNKIGRQHRIYAVLKKQYPTQWAEALKAARDESINHLVRFSQAITSEGDIAQYNLSVLLRIRLMGSIVLPNNLEFWITGYNQPINMTAMMSNPICFANITTLWGELREAQGEGKVSLVIYAKDISDKLYNVCKIEPSFDGGSPSVSQTKGVIYYFQEGRQLHLPTVWALLEDSWAKYKEKQTN